MPEVRRLDLPEYSTVERSLQEAGDLLPTELAENKLVGWVFDFGGATKMQTETPFRKDFRDRPDRLWAAVLGRMASSILQSQVPFYFASIFHIGRMIAVSDEALSRIDRLQNEETLAASIERIQVTLQNRSIPAAADFNSIRRVLVSTCEVGRSYQSEQRQLGEKWWALWQDEVRELREAFKYVEDGWRECNEFGESWRMVEGVVRLWHATAAGVLREAMTRTGVSFKSVDTPRPMLDWNLGALNPIVLIALVSSLGRRHHHPEPWFEFEHLFRQWLDVEKSKADADRRRSDNLKCEFALVTLQHKYGTLDPFEQFGTGRSAPSMQLRALVREHTLPDGSPSPWLSGWLNQLINIEAAVDGALFDPERSDDDGPEWCRRTADSAIKYAIGDSSASKLPWKMFLQRLFEKNWVVKIVILARNANNKPISSSTKLWTDESLHRLIWKTVFILNRCGYSLETPSIERLGLLLGMLEDGKIIYESTEW